MINRRSLLVGLLATPALVRAGSLDYVPRPMLWSPIDWSPHGWYRWVEDYKPYGRSALLLDKPFVMPDLMDMPTLEPSVELYESNFPPSGRVYLA